MGMCFGVRDAIELAQGRAAAGPVTVLGDLVHNDTVLADLRGRGVLIRQDASDIPTREVLITAHGASNRRIEGLRQLGLTVTEATCPLVHRAHQALQKLVAAGFHPLVIGQAGHVEVRGLTEDHPGCDVVLTENEVDQLPERPRYGVVSQTTQPVARVRELVTHLRLRFPGSEVRWIDTVCQPTKDRQTAAEELASRCDVVLVIGGIHSNNTRRLVDTCQSRCSRVHWLQTPDDLDPAWIRESDTVGITAGTSTPDSVIEAIETALKGLPSRKHVPQTDAA
ncbi:MAG: 4-hydroxy-3-methylbut-2-enyl diphosphate reductase [Verrucomicrobiota bacterium]|jgi:4-hydroxy-3-methylbut-2-enyl diphosphate reductase